MDTEPINYVKQKFKMVFGRFITFVLLSRRGVLLSFIHPEFRDLRNGTILYYNDPYRAKIFDFVRQLKNEIETKLGYNEAYQIFMTVRSVAKISGDMAEVGVYKGGSAKIICEAEKSKILHLFDTFEGLPEVSIVDSKWFSRGQYRGTLDEVQVNLKEYRNIYFYPGFFPKTAENLKAKKFSFVHLDVDIYESTLRSLEFFYQRMNRGGVIISHDYISATGVRKAFDEFFKDKPEPIIEMSGSQCLIVKI